MSRRTAPTRLWLREREGRPAVFVILDRGRQISTGCGVGEREAAEEALADYLGQRRIRERRAGDPSEVRIADILNLYVTDRAPTLRRPDIVASVVPLLLKHAKDGFVSAIDRPWCEKYVQARVSGRIAPDTIRHGHRLPKKASVARDLEVLSAALSYAVDEAKLLASRPKITKPAPSRPRYVFLTRAEAAALLWSAWRCHQLDGEGRRIYTSRHLARFILVGLYSGTRPGTILNTSFTAAANRSFVDLARGVYFRRPESEAEQETKLRPPVSLPDRLLAHMRRWQSASPGGWVIGYDGGSIQRIDRALRRAVRDAGIDKAITPHALRHTFMTWGLGNGVSLDVLSKIAGMSLKVADKVYGHLDPDRREAHNAAIANPNRWRFIGAGRKAG